MNLKDKVVKDIESYKQFIEDELTQDELTQINEYVEAHIEKFDKIFNIIENVSENEENLKEVIELIEQYVMSK